MNKIVKDKSVTYIYTEEEYKDLEESYYALKDAYDSVYRINQELYDILKKLGNNVIGDFINE